MDTPAASLLIYPSAFNVLNKEEKAIKTNNKNSSNDSHSKTLPGKQQQKKKQVSKFLNFKRSVRLNELNCKSIHPQSQRVNISRQRRNCLFSKWLPSRLVLLNGEIIRNLDATPVFSMLLDFWMLFVVFFLCVWECHWGKAVPGGLPRRKQSH